MSNVASYASLHTLKRFIVESKHGADMSGSDLLLLLRLYSRGAKAA
jgi:hypothetical protein